MEAGIAARPPDVRNQPKPDNYSDMNSFPTRHANWGTEDAQTAQVVFLHIEKSSGTSQWVQFHQRFDPKNIFRRDENIEALRHKSIADMSEYLVVGGHVSISDFLHCRRPLLFCSVVREPVSRAVSLFHYFSNHARKVDLARWRKKGLDPDSMRWTIDNVPMFRSQITNLQCYRLSGKRTVNAALKSIHTNNFVVGTFDNVSSFNGRLARILEWPEIPLGRFNAAPTDDYQQRILAEPGLRELIESLNVEDIALYRHIAELGVHEHVPDAAVFRTRFSAAHRKTTATIEYAPEVLSRIRIETATNEPISLTTNVRVAVCISNNSAVALNDDAENPVCLAFHWYDESGEMVEREGTRSTMPLDIRPGESIRMEAVVQTPKSIVAGRYRIRFCLLREGVRWLDQIDDTHTAWVAVRVEDAPCPDRT